MRNVCSANLVPILLVPSLPIFVRCPLDFPPLGTRILPLNKCRPVPGLRLNHYSPLTRFIVLRRKTSCLLKETTVPFIMSRCARSESQEYVFPSLAASKHLKKKSAQMCVHTRVSLGVELMNFMSIRFCHRSIIVYFLFTEFWWSRRCFSKCGQQIILLCQNAHIHDPDFCSYLLKISQAFLNHTPERACNLNKFYASVVINLLRNVVWKRCR